MPKPSGEGEKSPGKIEQFMAAQVGKMMGAVMETVDVEKVMTDFYEAIRFSLTQQKRTADALERIASALERQVN